MSLALAHSSNPREPRDVFETQHRILGESIAKIRRESWRVYSAPFMAQVIGQALEESGNAPA